jgi:hypothetical protein
VAPRRSLATRAPGPYRNHQGWDADEYRSLLTSGPGREGALTVRILPSPSLVLKVLNLLPVPPLDGGKVLCWFLRESIAQRHREVMARPTAQAVGGLAVRNLLEAVLRPIPAPP